MDNILYIPRFLSPEIVPVLGNKDYNDHKQLLDRVDRILGTCGIETRFVQLCLEDFHARADAIRAAGGRPLDGPEAIARHRLASIRALRCSVLQHLLGIDYRQMSRQLALCPLYQDFCGLPRVAAVQPPGKSTLNKYAHRLAPEHLQEVIATLTAALRDGDRAKLVGLENELDMGVVWVDSTCLKANIHFPVDWVLLRDGVRTLVGSILTIRQHGLAYRMPEPESFLREINALCMAMTAAGRRGAFEADSRKRRKKTLRAMKKLSRTVLDHARRYRTILDDCWQESDLTRPQAEVILKRMDNVIGQLPEACRQAHERIIGERKVPSEEKILSLYESDIHVIVRGKAGASVEFGNTLFIAENADGYILDHELLKDKSRGDAKILEERYERIREKSGQSLCGLVGDRGFATQKTTGMLDADGVFDGLCPKDPKKLAERIEKDEIFAAAMKRRAQIEGRVGILKNVFLEGTPRSKGFHNRRTQVAWAVLAHNLWVVARLPWAEDALRLAKAA